MTTFRQRLDEELSAALMAQKTIPYLKHCFNSTNCLDTEHRISIFEPNDRVISQLRSLGYEVEVSDDATELTISWENATSKINMTDVHVDLLQYSAYLRREEGAMQFTKAVARRDAGIKQALKRTMLALARQGKSEITFAPGYGCLLTPDVVHWLEAEDVHYQLKRREAADGFDWSAPYDTGPPRIGCVHVYCSSTPFLCSKCHARYLRSDACTDEHGHTYVVNKAIGCCTNSTMRYTHFALAWARNGNKRASSSAASLQDTVDAILDQEPDAPSSAPKRRRRVRQEE